MASLRTERGRTDVGGAEEDDELTRVVRSHLPLVRHVLSRIMAGTSPSTLLQYEDLLSCGMQGLLEAYHTYDGERGVKFSTYAVPRIRGAILDAIRAAHPLSRSLQKLSAEIDRAVSGLYCDLGRTPTKPEIAERLGISLDDLTAGSQATSIRVLSLESLLDMVNGGAQEKLYELADDDPETDPDLVVQQSLLRRKLRLAIDELPRREREIVRMYYINAQSLKRIGQALGISESRASQLRQRAVRRLRSLLWRELDKVA